MDPKQERDEWLMAQVANGRRDYLEPLVRRYGGSLLTFIERMIGNRHRSEELFQEVFLSVWKNRKQYRFPRLFRPWLYKIALNRCRADFRSQGKHGTVSFDESVISVGTEDQVSPSQMMINAELASLIANEVTKLPAQQRSVVVLRIWNGMSYHDIADIVQTAESTVRSHMHHGLAALRQTLQPHLEPSNET